MTSADNYRICSFATHAVLIAGDMGDAKWTERLEPWREMCKSCGLTIIAELCSDYHASVDEVDGIDDSGVLRGKVHYLERGTDLSDRTALGALAAYLVKLLARTSDA